MSLIRQASQLISGQAAAQMLALIALPFIARLYTPAELGVFSLVMTLAGVLLPLATLALPLALSVTTSPVMRAAIHATTLINISLVSASALLIAVSFSHAISTALNAPELQAWLWTVPLMTASLAYMQLSQHQALVAQRYSLIAALTAFQALLINVGKVLLGLVQAGALGLIVITWIGQMVLANLLRIFTPTQVRHNRLRLKHIKTVLRRYKDFPLLQAPQLCLNTLSVAVPLLLLSIYFGPAAAGFWALAKLILQAPVTLITKAAGDTLLGRAALYSKQPNQIRSEALKLTKILAAIGLLPFLVIAVYGDAILSFVLGNEWREAGKYAQPMAIWMFFAFMNAPAVKLFILFRRQHLSLSLNLISLVLRIAIFSGVAMLTQSPWWAITAYCAVAVLHNLVLMILGFSLRPRHHMLSQVTK